MFIDSILTAMFAVFSAIADWMIETVPKFEALFWTTASSGDGGSLTLLGVLAIAGLGVSICFLFIGIIQKFIHWRG